jgi:hypothetical protein
MQSTFHATAITSPAMHELTSAVKNSMSIRVDRKAVSGFFGNQAAEFRRMHNHGARPKRGMSEPSQSGAFQMHWRNFGANWVRNFCAENFFPLSRHGRVLPNFSVSLIKNSLQIR